MLSRPDAKKIKRLGERNDYPTLLSEVNEALQSGKAKSFAHDDIGLVITKPVFHRGRVGMLIWVAIGSCRNAMANYLSFFERITKDTGGSFVEFHTRRKGFKRLAPKFNFKEARPSDGFFVFRKEV